MVELAVLAPLFLRACGKVAGGLLHKAAERHVESFLGEQLQKLAQLGKKDDVVEAAQRAYALWFEWNLRNVQSTLGYDEEELGEEYGEAASKLLGDQAVFQELLKPVRDSEDETLTRKLALARETFRTRPRQPVLQAIGTPGTRKMVILGGAGSGKSTLLRYLLLSLLDPPTDPESGEPPSWMTPLGEPFPLLIELREYIAQQEEGGYTTFLDFLDHLGANDGYGLSASHLDERLRNEPSLVLFDGLDEIFDPAERERIAERIAAFAGDYPKARVVASSRPVGYPERPLRNAEFRHFGLEDLDDGQVEAFVQGWFRQVFPRREQDRQQRIERVLTATKRSKPIRLLAGNPMLLTIMTLIAQFRDLPRGRWQFYDYAAEVLCHHWDANRHLEDQGLGELLYLGVEDKKELLRRLAWRMQSADKGLAGNFIHQEVLADEIGVFVRERLQAGAAKGEVAKITDTLIERLRDRNYVLCLRGPKLYGFVHRTLLEYFCAAELARRLEKDPEFGIEDLQEVYLDRWEDEAWAEPLRLVCGMVGEKYAATLIEAVLTDNPDWTEREERPRHLVLAVQCLSEVAKLREIEGCAREVLSEVLSSFEYLARLPDDSSIAWHAALLLETELLPAAFEIGTLWPGRELVLEKPEESVSWGVQSRPFFRLAANLLVDRNEVFENLKELGRSHISAAVPGALVALAENWPQRDDVFNLIREQASKGEDWQVRGTAVETLARTWPQREELVKLLRERAISDHFPVVRYTAMETLARTWPQHQQEFAHPLLERATEDHHPVVRGTALGQVLAIGGRGEIVRVVYSWDLNGHWPCLDPLEPIPPDHLKKASAKLEMPEAELRDLLAAEEAFLGWNPLEGARAKRVKEEGEAVAG